MIVQQGYEIDSQGNIGNETRRIEDLQLRFILLMYVINTTIEDEEAKVRMSEQAVKTCHKESGIPMSELVSLIVRMTKEVKEITDYVEKILKKYRGFLDEMQTMSSGYRSSKRKIKDHTNLWFV